MDEGDQNHSNYLSNIVATAEILERLKARTSWDVLNERAIPHSPREDGAAKKTKLCVHKDIAADLRPFGRISRKFACIDLRDRHCCSGIDASSENDRGG